MPYNWLFKLDVKNDRSVRRLPTLLRFLVVSRQRDEADLVTGRSCDSVAIRP